MRSVEVRQLDGLNLEAIVRERRPVVVRGVLSQLACYAWLKPATLKARWGDCVIPVFENPRHAIGFLQSTAPIVMLRMDALLDAVFPETPRERGPRYYTRWACPPSVLEPDLHELSVPHILDHFGVWLGDAGNCTPIHSDAWHGFLGQLYGEKHVTLWPPGEIHRLYPKRFWDSSFNERPLTRLPADYRTADPAIFSDVEKSVRYETVLRRGELLYIPPHWLHQVVSLQGAISLVFRYRLPLLQRLSSIALMGAWSELLQATGISRKRTPVVARRVWERHCP
jgi:hypothetical protein